MKGVAVGFEPVPDGDYVAIFTAFKNGVTKNNDPLIRLQFTVNTPEEHAGKKLFMQQTVIATGEKSNLHFLKKCLVDLGADPDDLDGPIDTDVILNDLVGGEVTLKVGHREHNGQVYNDVNIRAGGSDGWSG